MIKRLLAYFLERGLLGNIITAGVLLAGFIFLITINREVFPRVDYNWIIVSTVYPGASPDDIEKHISIPIEKQLKEIDGVKEIYSSSIESLSSVMLQLDPDVKDSSKIVNDVRNCIDRITDMPKDAMNSVVTELNSTLMPIIEVSIADKNGINNDDDERELRKVVSILEDRFIEVPGVAKIEKRGYRNREMLIEVHPALLERYHIGLYEIIMVLSQKNLNFPGGSVKEKDEDILIRTIGEVGSAEEIRNVLIRANDMGNWVKIGDVATVTDTFEEEELLNKTNGKKAVTLTVLKKESADIVNIVEKIRTEVNKYNKIYGKKYEISISRDNSVMVKRRLNVLMSNAIFGFILVIVVIYISLGWRISIVTGLGLPFAFCATFIWMAYKGVTLNLMSMFGIIVVLGMLVDDAIVVSENVYRHLVAGEPLKDAILDGTLEVVIPVAGSILTTVASFAPLMFMTGMIGKFMWVLPAVVSLALLASWSEAMLILPSHILDFERRRKTPIQQSFEGNEGMYKIFQDRYVKIITYVLNRRYKFFFLIGFIFFGSLVFAKFCMKLDMFPPVQVENIVIKAEAENNTTLDEMNKKLEKLEKIVSALPKDELDNFITIGGALYEQAMDPNTKLGSNCGTIHVNLTPEENRERKADKIIEVIREKSKAVAGEFVKLEFKFIETGPPMGSPINVLVKGDDFNKLKTVAAEYKEYLQKIGNDYAYMDKEKNKKISALKDIKDDFQEGKKEVQIYVDEKIASMAMISVYDVASTVRSCFKGTVATKIKKTDEEIGIRVIFPKEHRNNIESMKLIKISNRLGQLVPLSKIARFESAKSISSINRRTWKRAIQITANVDDNSELSSTKVNTMLIDKFENIDKKYPDVVVSYEGEFKDTEESVANLVKSFVIAFILIYIILVALFRSLGHPFIIINVIPLSFIGVIWTFFIHRMPFSFLGLLGVVGLAGVVVNNSIVLVDFIKGLRAKGLSPFDASVQAGAVRLRPIYLTTITTVFGLLPTAYGIGGSDPFLKPMALSMGWGLLFGTLITLIATPILYNIMSDIRILIFKKERTPESFAPLPDLFKDSIKDGIMDHLREDIEKDLKYNLKRKLEEEILVDFEKKGVKINFDDLDLDGKKK